MRIVVPDYYDQFCCLAGECTHSCCIGWEIDVDAEALSFYDVNDTDQKNRAAIGQLIYDIATIFLYTHRYDKCESYLELSRKFDSGDNQHRTYVTSILYAVQGKREESQKLLGQMSDFLKSNCRPMLEAIFANKDPHYCVVPQDGSAYPAFWSDLALQKATLEDLISNGQTAAAIALISDRFGAAMAFMKRKPDCRIELQDGTVSVFCKNYCVKTLMADYDILFSQKPALFENWKFVSVDFFES